MNDRQTGYAALAALAAVAATAGWLVLQACHAPFTTFVVAAENIGSLKLADPVLQRGVPAGHISAIAHNSREALLTIICRPPLPVYRDYHICIVDLGIMGDRMLTIEPGTASHGTVAAGDTLRAKFILGPSEALGMVGQLYDAVAGFAAVSQRMREGDAQQRSLIEHYHEVARMGDSVSAQLLSMLKALEETLPGLLDTVDRLIGTAQELSYRIARNAPMLLLQLDTLIARVDTAVTRIDSLSSTLLNRIELVESLQHGALYEQLSQARTTLGRLRSGVENLRRRSAQLKVWIFQAP